jgi:hypothetical protein
MNTTVVEEWRPVVGYEGLYEVSVLGRVRGVDRMVRGKHGLRAQRGTQKEPWHGGPYPTVRLCKEGVKATVPLHRLVAEAFLGEPPTEKHEVCHRDGVAAGDCPGNLYWGTRKQNMDDARRHGTISRGDAHPTSRLSAAMVTEIRILRTAKIKLHVLAARFNVSVSAVSMAARGVTWS